MQVTVVLPYPVLVPKGISGTSGHQSSTPLVVFDWQGMLSY